MHVYGVITTHDDLFESLPFSEVANFEVGGNYLNV